MLLNTSRVPHFSRPLRKVGFVLERAPSFLTSAPAAPLSAKPPSALQGLTSGFDFAVPSGLALRLRFALQILAP
jgi:hypothetical protein